MARLVSVGPGNARKRGIVQAFSTAPNSKVFLMQLKSAFNNAVPLVDWLCRVHAGIQDSGFCVASGVLEKHVLSRR